MSPLPEDTYLPGGWSCRGARDGELAFARDGGQFVVEAERTTEGPDPELDCPYAWALTYRQRTGVAAVGGPVGFVTTRDAAIEGLIACMREVNAALGAGPAIDLRTVLDGVDLSDEVPRAVEDERPAADPPRPDQSTPDRKDV